MARGGIFGNYVSFTLNRELAYKVILGKVRKAMKIGMTAWVEEAKSNIPVWSGGERSAITQIAGFVGIPVFGPGRDNRVSNTEPRPDAVAFAASRWPKAGYTLAERQAAGQASERFEPELGTVRGGKVFFRWGSTLPYFNVNERNNARQWGFKLIDPGPYFLREKCRNAFGDAVRSHLATEPILLRPMFNMRRFKVGD